MTDTAWLFQGLQLASKLELFLKSGSLSKIEKIESYFSIVIRTFLECFFFQLPSGSVGDGKSFGHSVQVVM